MTNRKKDIFLSICLTCFIVSFAVVLTVFFKQLYYFDITYLHIDQYTNLSIETIKKNYDVLIQYQSIFFTGALNFPDFVMSQTGRIHFEEVKNIFVALQVLMVVSGIGAIPFIVKNIKEKDYQFLKLTSILTVVIPSMIGLLASLDFDAAFTMFHNIVFRNNYWIFDYRTDPIITILPEDFFMHAFIMIVVIVFVLALISYLVYRLLTKEQIKEAGLDI